MYRALKLNQKTNGEHVMSIQRLQNLNKQNKWNCLWVLLGFVLSAIALAYVVSKHESSAGKTA